MLASIKKKLWLESYGAEGAESYKVNFARYANDGAKMLLDVEDKDEELLTWFNAREKKVCILEFSRNTLTKFTYRQISKHMTRIRSSLANSLRTAFNRKYKLTKEAKEYLHASASATERRNFANAVADRIKLDQLEEGGFLDLVLQFVDEHWANGEADSVSPESVAWACFIVSQYSEQVHFLSYRIIPDRSTLCRSRSFYSFLQDP